MARSFKMNLTLDDELHKALAIEAEETRRPLQVVIRDRLEASINPKGAAAQWYEKQRLGSYHDRMREEDRPS